MSTKAVHPLKSVTSAELSAAIVEINRRLDAQALTHENELTREINQLIERCATYENRQRDRINSVTFMFQELNLAVNDLAIGRQRDVNRIEMLTRRLVDLEARTFSARLRRIKTWWRAFVAELGGSWFYDEDDDLDPQLVDELRELYQAPGDFSRPLSPSPVRQDARHARQ